MAHGIEVTLEFNIPQKDIRRMANILQKLPKDNASKQTAEASGAIQYAADLMDEIADKM